MMQYYQSRYNIQAQVKRARKTQSPITTMSAERVWAAAVYAHRVNHGEYRKEPEYVVLEDGTLTRDIVRPANKTLMWSAIMDIGLLTDDDFEFARTVRDWTRKDLMIKALKGALSDFDQALTRAAERDDFVLESDRYEIALITSRPRAYEDGRLVEEAMIGISREPLAPVGGKIDETVTVVKSVWSQNYNVYFVTAITESRHAVFFSYRDRLANGRQCRIRGTVKAHRENSTQLNRVKIV